MSQDHRRPPDEVNPKIAAAALEVQREARERSETGTYLIVVNANQGGITAAVAYRGDRLN